MHEGPAFDIFTLAHVAVGSFLGRAGFSPFTAYGIIIGTEIAEQLIRRSFPESRFFLESPANVVVDLVASIGSYELTRPT